MFTIKQTGTTTPPPEGIRNNTDNPLQAGIGTVASNIQQLRDSYRQAQSALYYYQQAMQQPQANTAQTANNMAPELTAGTIASVATQTITIETHLAQHDGTAQNSSITSTQAQEYDPATGYQEWYSYYQQAYDIYQQQLGFLTDPDAIAAQIHDLSTTPVDGHTEASLKTLSFNIECSENPNPLFSVEAVNVVLNSLDSLKNYPSIWDILWKLRPHINFHTEEKCFLISKESINMILSSLNYCLLENGEKNYETTSDILLALLSHIETNTETNGYHISRENIENALHSINYRDTVYILPTLLPHIQYHAHYRLTLQDVVNIGRGLKDMAYIDISCRQHINNILLMLRAHITDKPANMDPNHYFSKQDIGIMMTSLTGMSNISYPGVDSFLAALEPHIVWQHQKKQLDETSLAIILQGLEGKIPSPAVDAILARMLTLTNELPSLSAKHISMAVSGLSMLAGSDKAKALLLTLLNKPISTGTLNNSPSKSESKLRVITMLYILSNYSQNEDIITAATNFIENNTISSASKIFNSGTVIIQKPTVGIITYLANIQGYNPENISFELDLHGCTYPLARALCEYVLKDFLEREDNSENLTIIVGQARHNQGNENNMASLIINIIQNDERFESLEWELPEDNSGRILIYPIAKDSDSYLDDSFKDDEASEDSTNSASSEMPGPPSLKKPKLEERL